MPNHAGALQGRFFPAKLETEGDDAIFNTLLGEMQKGRGTHRIRPPFLAVCQ